MDGILNHAFGILKSASCSSSFHMFIVYIIYKLFLHDMGAVSVFSPNSLSVSFTSVYLYSMQGLGTDDNTLIRIMTSRSEIDMVQIKTAFQNMYGKTLASFINVSLRVFFYKNVKPSDVLSFPLQNLFKTFLTFSKLFGQRSLICFVLIKKKQRQVCLWMASKCDSFFL